MNENEITRQMNRIKEMCEQMAHGCDQAKQQGRMPTLAEARKMAELSVEMLNDIRELPTNACALSGHAEHQNWSASVTSLVRETLERISPPNKPVRSGASSAPRASVQRMNAYNTY